MIAAVVAVVVLHSGLHVYDPQHAVRAEVTRDEVAYAHVGVSPATAQPIVVIGFDERGRRAFCTLTRALSVRGARRHRMQRIAVAVDGHVYARPYIDYRTYPHGLCVSPRVEIDVGSSALARRLAREIR